MCARMRARPRGDVVGGVPVEMRQRVACSTHSCGRGSHVSTGRSKARGLNGNGRGANEVAPASSLDFFGTGTVDPVPAYVYVPLCLFLV